MFFNGTANKERNSTVTVETPFERKYWSHDPDLLYDLERFKVHYEVDLNSGFNHDLCYLELGTGPITSFAEVTQHLGPIGNKEPYNRTEWDYLKDELSPAMYLIARAYAATIGARYFESEKKTYFFNSLEEIEKALPSLAQVQFTSLHDKYNRASHKAMNVLSLTWSAAIALTFSPLYAFMVPSYLIGAVNQTAGMICGVPAMFAHSNFILLKQGLQIWNAKYSELKQAADNPESRLYAKYESAPLPIDLEVGDAVYLIKKIADPEKGIEAHKITCKQTFQNEASPKILDYVYTLENGFKVITTNEHGIGDKIFYDESTPKPEDLYSVVPYEWQAKEDHQAYLESRSHLQPV